MACLHPHRAWRTTNGNVVLGKALPDAEPLALPCGNCLGCRTANARAWALRCQLELQEHNTAVFTTLTYNERYLPPTLNKEHLQTFMRLLRKRMGPERPVRFFACGEYGETNLRPHYHAILYGPSENHAKLIQLTWKMGHTKTVRVTPQAIAYTAGYTSKKIGYLADKGRERIDPKTGEVYQWEPPFIQMSRQPGIGGAARHHTDSWKNYAIHNGTMLAVPRYLHEAWKAQATEEQKEQLAFEKETLRQTRKTTLEMLDAKEKIMIKAQEIKAARRNI